MGHRILLVEDDPEVLDVTREILVQEGHAVDAVTDGYQAVEQANRRAPDAFVIDLLMPRMHGFELLRQLRADDAFLGRPIIVVSGKAFGSDKGNALALGADAFLTKPVQRDELAGELRRLLHTTTVAFWGTRGSIAVSGRETVRYGGCTPCLTVKHGEQLVVLDAGSGLLKLGQAMQKAAGGDPLDIHMLISHTHWDHIQGFPFFGPAFVPQNTVHIYGPATAGKPLDKVLTGQMDPEYFPVGLSQMGAKIICDQLRGEPFQVGPFDISYMYMNHPGVTLGYRLEAGGHVVVYATDTEPYHRMLPRRGHAAEQEGEAFGRACDEALVEFARDADLYIADSQYSPEDYAKKTGWGHSCYLDAAEVAIQAAVKRLVLFSHDPMHDDDALDHKLEVVRAYVAERAPGIEVSAAADCSVVRLPL